MSKVDRFKSLFFYKFVIFKIFFFKKLAKIDDARGPASYNVTGDISKGTFNVGKDIISKVHIFFFQINNSL